ncbi:MAG TPA: MlaD family protein [Solirubrobacteraceae bacterium]|nr:MlaD family protein [Solirubrobacteraceae bacterium]
MTAIRKHLKEALAVLGLVAVAAGVSLYILDNQRMRFPWEEAPLRLKAEFSTAQAVTPGQGQTVRVAGVRIGDIGEVELRDGRGVVEMVIDPEYEGMVRTDATALLRPKTGLKDMFIDLEPGSDDAAVAKEGFTVPISATAPDVNPDEVLAELDADTRDYLRLLIGDAGRGLKGRGLDLREVLRRFEPTHRDLARVNSEVAKRRQNLRHLITSLNTLNAELASRGDDLAGLVDSSAAVMRSFASEEANVSAAVAELPGALQETTATMTKLERYGELLGPTAEKLRPAARALAPANDALRPLAREATPLLRDDIRPFVREARPVVRDLRPAASNLAKATPALTRSFMRLNRFLNLLAHNPNGREDPGNAARQEGYLFWVAWAQHMATQLFSSSDAHGVFRPVTVAAPCATIEQLVREEPELEFLQMLTPILTDSQACATE